MATVPATFYDAIHGIRADLVEKILPSPTFWNLMIDREVLSSYHVEKLKVFPLPFFPFSYRYVQTSKSWWLLWWQVDSNASTFLL